MATAKVKAKIKAATVEPKMKDGVFHIATQLHTVFLLIDPSPGPARDHFAYQLLLTALKRAHQQRSAEVDVRVRSLALSVDRHRINLAPLQSPVDHFDAQFLDASAGAYVNVMCEMRTAMLYGVEFIVLVASGMKDEQRRRVLDLARELRYSVEAVILDYKDKQLYSASTLVDKQFLHEKLDALHRTVLPSLGARGRWFQNIHKLNRLPQSIDIAVTDHNEYLRNHLPSSASFAVIGDIHGCFSEFCDLLKLCGVEMDSKDPIGQPVKFKRDDRHIVLVGDYLDKGPDVELLIRFLHKQVVNVTQPRFHIVRGNHETYAQRRVMTDEPLEHPEFHDSVPRLRKNRADLGKLFLELFEMSHDFLVYRAHRFREQSFVVTHAPCHRHNCAKLNPNAIRAQTYYYLDRTATKKADDDDEKSVLQTPRHESLLERMEKEGVLTKANDRNMGQPPIWHVWGHVALIEPFVSLEHMEVGIDTGCVVGNRLSAAIFQHNKLKPQIISTPAKHPKPSNTNLLQILTKSTNYTNNTKPIAAPSTTTASTTTASATTASATTALPTTTRELTVGEEERLEHMLKQGVNYVSGTVPPAPSDLKKGDIESLELGLDYFRRHLTGGDRRVIVEPKWMGSRCNIYLTLNDDYEGCFAVSRNGYVIRRPELAAGLKRIYQKLQVRLGAYMLSNNIQMMILDGELLPWRALGDGLIRDQYEVVAQGHRCQLEFMQRTGFDLALQQAKHISEQKAFAKDLGATTAQELYKKHGNHTQTLRVLHEGGFSQNKDTIQHRQSLNQTFQQQLNLYAPTKSDAKKKDDWTDLEYQGFSVLKVVHKDGSETMGCDLLSTEEQLFRLVSDHSVPYLVVNLDAANDAKAAKEFFDKMTNENGSTGSSGTAMEGVVIKPLVQPKDTHLLLAPMMKVRNPRYLSLIYGPEYTLPLNHEKLMRKKCILRKTELSAREFHIGQEMLKTPFAQIKPSNHTYRNLVAKFLFAEAQEANLDPAL
jgi:hypothetical protein